MLGSFAWTGDDCEDLGQAIAFGSINGIETHIGLVPSAFVVLLIMICLQIMLFDLCSPDLKEPGSTGWKRFFGIGIRLFKPLLFIFACYSTLVALTIPAEIILLAPYCANWVQSIALVTFGQFILICQLTLVYCSTRMLRRTTEIPAPLDEEAFRWSEKRLLFAWRFTYRPIEGCAVVPQHYTVVPSHQAWDTFVKTLDQFGFALDNWHKKTCEERIQNCCPAFTAHENKRRIFVLLQVS